MTLTDLQTRRAGLSASAELLIFPWGEAKPLKDVTVNRKQ